MCVCVCMCVPYACAHVCLCTRMCEMETLGTFCSLLFSLRWMETFPHRPIPPHPCRGSCGKEARSGEENTRQQHPSVGSRTGLDTTLPGWKATPTA